MPIIFDKNGNKDAVSCKDCKYYLSNIDKCAKFPVLDLYCTHFVRSETAVIKVRLGDKKRNESDN